MIKSPPFVNSLFYFIMFIFVLSCNRTNTINEIPNEKIAVKINGHEIYLADVDSCISQQLFDNLDAIYLARKKAADALIELNIIRIEADKQKLNPSLFLERYFELKLPFELQEYYSNPLNQSIPIIKEHKLYYKSNKTVEAQLKIISSLKQKLKKQLIDSLKNKYEITFQITPPVKKFFLDSSIKSYNVGNMNSNFEVTIFTDFDCSTCQSRYPFFKKLMAQYSTEIKFRIIYYSNDVYPQILAINAADKQSKFFEVFKKLFEEKYNPFDFSYYRNLAFRLNLDTLKFGKDFTDTIFFKNENHELEKIKLAGICNTPTIIVNNYFVSNYATESSIEYLIKTELNSFKRKQHQ